MRNIGESATESDYFMNNYTGICIIIASYIMISLFGM